MGKGRRKKNPDGSFNKWKKDPNRNRYWMKLQNEDNANDAHRQPQSRGNETGLVQTDQGTKTTKEVLVILKIPSAVVTQIVSNIEAIENLAEKQKIPIKGTESFIKEVKFDRHEIKATMVKPEPAKSVDCSSAFNFKMPNPSTSVNHSTSTATIKTEGIKESQPLQEGTLYTGLKRPLDETIEMQSHKMSKPSTRVSHPPDQCSELITIKTEPTEDLECLPEEQINNMITKVELPGQSSDLVTVKTQTMEESECLQETQVLGIPKPLTDIKHPPGQSLNITPIKNEPVDEIEYPQVCQPIRLPKPFAERNNMTSENFIPVKTEATEGFIPVKPEKPEVMRYFQERQLFLRDGGHYKYGYQDILTGSFDEKLDEKLARGISICRKTPAFHNLSVAFYEEYMDMITREQFKSMMVFREKLPTYQKSAELLNTINNNQVVVISGETGCGKSTQVPQIILDDAICETEGAYVHILVTEPRRIAATSLASRVAQERAEDVGISVGYAVRLEKKESRARGSIMYVTAGMLLAELETNQALTNFSHIILDEAHERDSNVDLSMCMLKQVLKKRTDLKVILMSATIDSDRLAAYFGGCPIIHIEGLSFPVQTFYLEDVLTMTGFHLDAEYPWQRKKPSKPKRLDQSRDSRYRAEIGPWLENVQNNLSVYVRLTLQNYLIEEINVDLLMSLLIHICRSPPGAILVFLPGLIAITRLIKTMNASQMFPESMYRIYPLHSKLASLEQNMIFEKPPAGVRKIIIATNIAETSITIDDIVYVVDCGKIKLTGMDVEHNLLTLKNEFVSKANLIQRRGRAGRCQPGIVYHLLTSYRAQTVPDRHLPELQRSNLLEAVLYIKKLRLGMAQAAFKLVPDAPSEITIEQAVKHLQKCGALDDDERLTPLGWHLARLPVHPAAGKLVLFGALFGCVDRAASVAAVWGFKDPFHIVIGMEDKVDAAKRKLALGEPSDHVAISEAIIQWEQLGPEQRAQFANEHFLSSHTLQSLSEMKQQLCENLRLMGFLAGKNIRVAWENRNADNLSVFKAIVAASLYPNVGMVRWSRSWLVGKQQTISVTTPEDGKVNLHQSSIMEVTVLRKPSPRIPLCDKPGANWLVYWLKQKSTDLYLFEVTLVFTIPLLFFGELVVSQVDDSPDECYMSVSTVKVRCQKETANLLFKLRSLLDQVLASMIMESSDRSTRHSEFDELVFKAVIDLMTTEDERPEGLEDDSESELDRIVDSNYDYIPISGAPVINID